MESQQNAAEGRDPARRAGALVERLGPHPWTTLGESLDDEHDVARWLVAACILSATRDEGRAAAAFQALSASNLDSPGALATAPPGAACPALEASGISNAERTAHQLSRMGRVLEQRHGGSLDGLAGASESLEELGGRLSALAPGIGTATVTRFLRPLRERWPAAAELPLAPAARAAARHLGWIDASDDLEGEPSALRRALADLGDSLAFSDIESALERLGRRACVRERADRCPLEAICPLAPGSENTA